MQALSTHSLSTHPPNQLKKMGTYFKMYKNEAIQLAQPKTIPQLVQFQKYFAD